jgi:hypothetical protein
MSDRPRLFDGRLASLLVVIAILGAAIFIMVDALAASRAENAELARLEERLNLLEARARELTMDGDEAGDAVFNRRLLMFGETPGLVAAEFQRTVGFIAERTGAELVSVDIAEFERVSGDTGLNGESLQRVRLNAEIEVAEQALPDLLYNVEADFPILVIDSVNLRAMRRIDGAASELWAASDRVLSLRMTVSSFWTGADR